MQTLTRPRRKDNPEIFDISKFSPSVYVDTVGILVWKKPDEVIIKNLQDFCELAQVHVCRDKQGRFRGWKIRCYQVYSLSQIRKAAKKLKGLINELHVSLDLHGSEAKEVLKMLVYQNHRQDKFGCCENTIYSHRKRWRVKSSTAYQQAGKTKDQECTRIEFKFLGAEQVRSELKVRRTPLEIVKHRFVLDRLDRAKFFKVTGTPVCWFIRDGRRKLSDRTELRESAIIKKIMGVRYRVLLQKNVMKRLKIVGFCEKSAPGTYHNY